VKEGSKAPKWNRFDRWVVLGALLGLGLAIGTYIFVRFVIFGNPATSGNITPGDIISATATVLGGFTIGGVAVMQYRKHKWEEYQADYQARFAEQQAKLDEDTRTGERLSQAIEHLSEQQKLHTRLGAIYELERLKEDSHRDRERIAIILTRFIVDWQEKNEDSNKPPQDIDAAARVLSPIAKGSFEETVEKASKENRLRPPTYLFEAAEALSGLAEEVSGRFVNKYLEWDGFRAAHINADYTDKDRRIELKGALLLEANLQGARLYAAKLQGARLDSANLQGAWLDSAELQGAWLEDAKLQDANFNLADLQGACLCGAKLQGAYFIGANLQDASLEGANLQGAYLHADLQGADLCSASLQGAQLKGASLQGAQLAGAELQGADLSCIKLDEETLFSKGDYKAIIDEYTKFDPGVREKYFPDFGRGEESE